MQPLEVVLLAAYLEKAVLEAAERQVGFEFRMNMVGQRFAPLCQWVHRGRLVRCDELVEWCRLRLVAPVDSLAKAIPALCQLGGPALGLHRAE